MSLKDIVTDRKFVVTGGALLLSLLLFVYFPTTDRLSLGVQSVIMLAVFFLLFPILYLRYIARESYAGMGFRMGAELSHWVGVFGAVAFGSALFFFGYQTWPAFGEAYRLPFSVERSFFSFLRYELFALCVVFFYEVFFRGFVMLFFLRSFGAWSVFLQWIVFMLFLAVSQSLGMSQGVMLLFAPFAGWVAYRSRSILYSFIATALFLLLIDIFLLLHNR